MLAPAAAAEAKPGYQVTPPRFETFFSATLEPGGPFVGSASLSQSPGQPAAWSGSLGVELPGAGIVPLTGPTFAAALCRGPGEPEQRPCSELLGE